MPKILATCASNHAGCIRSLVVYVLYDIFYVFRLFRSGELQKHSVMEIRRAKQLYESAFHPDTGEKQNVFGRMCFQMPGGMAITGVMLSFYRYLRSILFRSQPKRTSEGWLRAFSFVSLLLITIIFIVCSGKSREGEKK